MAYSETLEAQIDAAAADLGIGFKKKQLFGGLAYFVKGRHMAFAIRGEELLFRVHEAEAEELLGREGVHPAVMGDRQMHGWMQAGGEAIAPGGLEELLTIGYDYARELPPRPKVNPYGVPKTRRKGQ